MKKMVGMTVVIVLFITAGVFFMISHSDEQVASIAFTDKAVTDIGTFDSIINGKTNDAVKSVGVGTYFTETIEFGKYKERVTSGIAGGKDLFACIHYIASPEGIKYKAKWIYEGKVLKEEVIPITSDKQQQVIAYSLDSSLVKKGDYTFELYYKEKRLYKKHFKVK